jgi:hypothetical protein
MWKNEAPYFTNWKGRIIEVDGKVDQQEKLIRMGNKADKLYQQWDIIYVDEMEDEPEKGELNKQFGLVVERPFYIVSELGSNRYLSVINNRNLAIKTQHGRNTQEWYFHQETKTIRTKLNNQSFDIHGSGKNKNMQIWSTNSHWW